MTYNAVIEAWGKDVEGLRPELGKVDGLLRLKPRLSSGWAAVPEEFLKVLAGLIAIVEARPDQTATLDAQTFLSTAQLRLEDHRAALRQRQRAETASAAAKATYDAYCKVMEAELDALYQDVQEDFSTFYRLINEGDEEKFTAKLTPSAGKLDFSVNFYERGLFPPAAFHSEGHQDGMGVCLYLALMKRLFGDAFTLALLDDVVMSVDSGHRSASFLRRIFQTRSSSSRRMTASGQSRCGRQALLQVKHPFRFTAGRLRRALWSNPTWKCGTTSPQR